METKIVCQFDVNVVISMAFMVWHWRGVVDDDVIHIAGLHNIELVI